ncbi:MAG: PBSX family phage terminase large subunit [Elusimicrobia bacterium]|nr:PBSX family phage terminase large subunit [Elusimicrobiota bacterium]
MLTVTNVFNKNAKARKDGFRYIINQGGTSSSKTFSILQLLTLIAIKHKKHIDIVGLSVPHLKSGVLNDMPAIFEQFGLNWHLMFNKADKYVEFENGGMLQFIAFDNIGKAHGGRRDILYLNEANHLNYNIVEQLMVRTRDCIFIDYNPTNAFWVHKKLQVEEADKTILIKSTYKDNQYLEQTIIDSIESRKGDGNNNFWRVYGLGELGIAEGLVFNNFEQKEFDKARFSQYFYGVDWGFSSDPYAFVEVAIEQNNLYICNEVYKKGYFNKQTAELIKPICKNSLVVCDSAEPKSIAEYQSLGINAIATKKGKGSIESGIKYIQQFDKVFIHTSCPNVYDEFCNYQWKQDKNGDNMPQPVDNFNHCLAGDTLITTSNGQIPIKDIKIGDFVLTRKGYKKVLWSGITERNAKVYVLKTKNGLELKATFNHKIYTNTGFRDIIKLRYGDELLITKEYLKWLKDRQLNTTAKFGTDTRTQKEAATETTIKNVANSCIITFGKNITDNAKKGIIYIILTVILAIIQLKTWKKLRQNNTQGKDISFQKKEQSSKDNGVIKSEHLQKIGTHQQKDTNGISNTLNLLISDIKNSDLADVKFVEKSSKKIQNISDFVQMLASQNIEETKGLTILLKLVIFAVKNLLQANIQKQDFVQDNAQIIICGNIEKEVYDLTVEDCHEFFANGILVHNCIDAIRYALELNMNYQRTQLVGMRPF